MIYKNYTFIILINKARATTGTRLKWCLENKKTNSKKKITIF